MLFKFGLGPPSASDLVVATHKRQNRVSGGATQESAQKGANNSPSRARLESPRTRVMSANALECDHGLALILIKSEQARRGVKSGRLTTRASVAQNEEGWWKRDYNENTTRGPVSEWASELHNEKRRKHSFSLSGPGELNFLLGVGAGARRHSLQAPNHLGLAREGR